MTKIIYITILFFGFLNLSLAQENPLRVMTYNIRYANNNIGEEWNLRKDDVAEMLRFHKPDIFGLQEALFEQVEYISNEFEDFSRIGVGRDDGIRKGEFSPLFFSKKFWVKDSGTFWLSETPDTPSIGWDASYTRIATWSIIERLDSSESFFVINTHFDHKGEVARRESARLLLSKIGELSQHLPIILMGDFNFTKESDAFIILNNSGLIIDANEKSQNHYGTNNTFNGFEREVIVPEKIDFIFVSNNIHVIHHAIIGDKFDNKFPSDHMPVIIDALATE